MELLENRIKEDGKVLPGNILKVDSFLNHQLDIKLIKAMAEEFKRLYEGVEINKILTIEASGIAIATMCGDVFDVPVVFAKKSQTKNLDGSIYMAKVDSFTHNRVYDVCVSKSYLNPGDKVLIVDDFLANGKALNGLIDIVEVAKAEVVGAGIAIEKCFQPGGAKIRERGIRVESLAKIKSMSDHDLEFE